MTTTPFRPHGIIPPLVTPLLSAEELDVPALHRIVSHVIDGGVDGIFLMGTTGEGPLLCEQLKVSLIEAGSEAVAGRVPLLIGITHTSLVEAVSLAEAAYHAGATAVVAAAPYYLPASQLEIRSYFEQLADASPLPVLLYDMPGCVKTVLEPKTIAALSEHPNVIGLKDSTGDVDHFRAVRAALPDPDAFPVLIGPERLMVELRRAGAVGAVSAGANVFPRQFAKLNAAIESGDTETADRLQAWVREAGAAFYELSPHPSRVIVGTKTALHLRGLCEPICSPGILPLDEAAMTTAKHRLDRLVGEAVGVTE